MKSRKQQFEIDNVRKALEIIKALEAKGIKIIDWDDEEVEVQFPNGDRKRWSTFWAASHLTRELAKD